MHSDCRHQVFGSPLYINFIFQDTNGNTVTHIMVVFNNMKMFDMAVECGATINTTNNLVSKKFCRLYCWKKCQIRLPFPSFFRLLVCSRCPAAPKSAWSTWSNRWGKVCLKLILQITPLNEGELKA